MLSCTLETDIFEGLIQVLEARGHARVEAPDEVDVSWELNDDSLVVAPESGACSLSSPYNYLIHMIISYLK